jgi:hypothetical protein
LYLKKIGTWYQTVLACQLLARGQVQQQAQSRMQPQPSNGQLNGMFGNGQSNHSALFLVTYEQLREAVKPEHVLQAFEASTQMQ